MVLFLHIFGSVDYGAIWMKLKKPIQSVLGSGSRWLLIGICWLKPPSRAEVVYFLNPDSGDRAGTIGVLANILRKMRMVQALFSKKKF